MFPVQERGESGQLSGILGDAQRTLEIKRIHHLAQTTELSVADAARLREMEQEEEEHIRLQLRKIARAEAELRRQHKQLLARLPAAGGIPAATPQRCQRSKATRQRRQRSKAGRRASRRGGRR